MAPDSRSIIPQGQSINDGISQGSCSLQYASLDNAVDIIIQIGHGTRLVKLDLANAYRMAPVYPDNQPLLGIHWQGHTFFDRALPFGLRFSPKIFNAVANLLALVLHCEGVQLVIHYLDDFLVFEPPGLNTASTARALVESILSHIGTPIAHHKTQGPATMLSFLGILIDTD